MSIVTTGRKMTSLLVLFLVSNVAAARWPHSVHLSPAYVLLWAPGPAQDEITFEVQVRTKGYVGFGLNHEGSMAGADIVVGWVDHGQVYFQDRHVKSAPVGSTDREPEVDPSQDYQLLLGYENSTHTVLRFRRKLDTCDHHDIPITNDTVHILWTYHPDEPQRGAVGPGTLPRHDSERRGSKPIFLLQRAESTNKQSEEELKMWEVKQGEMKPGTPGKTIRWCQVVRGPPGDERKHHIVKYDPILLPEVTPQRIILYECLTGGPNLVTLASSGAGWHCHESPQISCESVLVSWSNGEGAFSFPDEAGLPIQTSSYYLLETQYPAPKAIDVAPPTNGAGLRLHYTPKLRPHDLGVISLGIEPNWRHLIPPGQFRVVSQGHCVADCTAKAFPEDGVKMFAVKTITGNIGKAVKLRHIRGDVELPPIVLDSNLDPSYQDYRHLPAPIKILPGDDLVAECTYNSSTRTAITLGGYQDTEETCLVLGMYYPKQTRMMACRSLPSLATVLRSLGIRELSSGTNPVRIAAPPELAGMTLESRLVSYDWDNEFDAFQEVTSQGSFKPLCWTPQSKLLQGTDDDRYFPNITHPYETSNVDQCNYSRYVGGQERPLEPRPILQIDRNNIQGEDLVARNKVSRSNSRTSSGDDVWRSGREQSLRLGSRYNSGVMQSDGTVTLVVGLLLVCWINR